MLSLWVSVSALVFCIAIVFFALSICDDWLRIIGQLVWSVGTGVLALTILVSMSVCAQEYAYLCHVSNRYIGKIVAHQTNEEVRKMTSSSM